MARHDVLPVTPWATRPERSQTLYYLARVRCCAQGLAGASNKVEPLLFSVEGTSNNCNRSSGTSNLLANDSALFSFRFCAVHPKDVRDCQLRQLFEVP